MRNRARRMEKRPRAARDEPTPMPILADVVRPDEEGVVEIIRMPDVDVVGGLVVVGAGVGMGVWGIVAPAGDGFEVVVESAKTKPLMCTP